MQVAIQKADGSSGEERARALLLLREALAIIDSLREYPEVGARLNDVIESLADEPETK